MSVDLLAELIGAKSLYLLYVWLLSGAAAAWLAHRKGYGERPGLAAGLILPVVGPIIWLVVPPRQNSLWKKVGPFGRPQAGDILPESELADAEPSTQHATSAADAAAQPTSGETAPPPADTSERP